MRVELTAVQAGYRNFTLKEVTLSLPPGRMTALIGPNGSGKSTLFGAMAGNLPIRAGRIVIGGLNIARSRPRDIARQVALLPQAPMVPPGIRVEQLVAYGRAPYQNFLGLQRDGDARAIADAMARAGISAHRGRALGDLSGGQRQRAFIAMCLAQDTPAMLLDEPTSFLDIRYQYETMHLLADLAASGRTVVTVLHDIGQAARFADHLVVMKGGAVCYQGAPGTVVDRDMLEDVYEIAAEVYADPVSGSPQISPTKPRTDAAGVAVPGRARVARPGL